MNSRFPLPVSHDRGPYFLRPVVLAVALLGAFAAGFLTAAALARLILP